MAQNQHHLDRQASPQRHRRTHHAARGLQHIAIVPGDDQCIFGSGKQHGTMRKTKHHGTGAVAAEFLLNLIA